MKVTTEWQGGMKFLGENERGNMLVFDVPVEGKPTAGPTPMEGYLQSMIACSGVDIVNILTKRRLKVKFLKIEADAVQACNPPKVFQRIRIKYIISGEGINNKEMDRAIDLSVNKFCSVKAMVDRSATDFDIDYEIL